MADRDDVLRRAAGWLADGKGVALATVIDTWGSSPSPPGSILAVNRDSAFVGSVSGGCIEGAVIKEALAVIGDGRGRLLEFGVSDERAWEVGLACGGRMTVHVNRAERPEVLERLISERPLALATHLDSSRQALIGPLTADGELDLDDQALAAARQALTEDRSTTLGEGEDAVFVAVFNRPLRMVVVGAVHIAQSLAPMAALAGFEVIVVDPRGAFATAERFPDATLNGAWPDEALAEIGPDSMTAVVALTHDPKLDDPALAAALGSAAFYIGALGSRKSHARRLERLRKMGFTDDQLGRIRAPVGLDLGGRRPAEIAVSILAQALAARHGKG